jgi:hypothetical protein
VCVCVCVVVGGGNVVGKERGTEWDPICNMLHTSDTVSQAWWFETSWFETASVGWGRHSMKGKGRRLPRAVAVVMQNQHKPTPIADS